MFRLSQTESCYIISFFICRDDNLEFYIYYKYKCGIDLLVVMMGSSSLLSDYEKGGKKWKKNFSNIMFLGKKVLSKEKKPNSRCSMYKLEIHLYFI